MNPGQGHHLRLNGWDYYDYDVRVLYLPFEDIMIDFYMMQSGNPYYVGIFIDDVTLELNPTGAEVTSWGKIKAVYR